MKYETEDFISIITTIMDTSHCNKILFLICIFWLYIIVLGDSFIKGLSPDLDLKVNKMCQTKAIYVTSRIF